MNLLLLFQSLDTLWYPLSIIVLYLGAIILIAEIVNRLSHISAELTRKIVHIGTGHVILLAWWFAIPAWVAIGASFIASIIALISYFIPILPSINSVGRKSLGTFFYAISIGILVAWFWQIQQPQYAAIGIMVMAWGDGLAAIIGQRFGKHTYQFFGSKKSWEGSLTMVLVSYSLISLILLLVQANLGQVMIVAAIVAILVAMLETVSWLGIDNLTVPLGSAALCYFLMQFI